MCVYVRIGVGDKENFRPVIECMCLFLCVVCLYVVVRATVRACVRACERAHTRVYVEHVH